jgi:long-chain fatty acid transport protein
MNYKTTGLALTALGLGLATQASATNGVNLIGIGPISRALGGTGIAAPQDAVSAVFSNPAAMCISDVCSKPQVDFSLTTFMPNTKAKWSSPMGSYGGDSDSDLYFIPALGVSLPIGGDGSHWRGGFAIYGISGLGADYEKVQGNQFIPFDYTGLEILKIAPSIAYSVTPDVSIGASMHIQYASLEIGSHNVLLPPGAPSMTGKYDDSDWAVGLQVGATWKVSRCLTAGITYITAQKNDFSKVMPDPRGPQNFSLEAPQQVGGGVAWVGMEDKLTLSADVNWFNWGNAEGYSDFGWQDQWTFGVGAQYEVIEDKLILRAGYNYGKNPLKNQTIQQDMASIVGFPAIVEHHVGLGFGYRINEDLSLNVSWVHAFENTMKSSGTLMPGFDSTVESSLSEDTIDLGLSWRF